MRLESELLAAKTSETQCHDSPDARYSTRLSRKAISRTSSSLTFAFMGSRLNHRESRHAARIRCRASCSKQQRNQRSQRCCLSRSQLSSSFCATLCIDPRDDLSDLIRIIIAAALRLDKGRPGGPKLAKVQVGHPHSYEGPSIRSP